MRTTAYNLRYMIFDVSQISNIFEGNHNILFVLLTYY